MSPSEVPANSSSDAGPPNRGGSHHSNCQGKRAVLLSFVVAKSSPTVLFFSRACHAVFPQIPLSETIYLQFLVLNRWLGPRKTPWAKFRVTLCSGPPYYTVQHHSLDLPSTLPSSSPQGSPFKHLLQGTRRSQVCPLPLSSAPSPAPSSVIVTPPSLSPASQSSRGEAAKKAKKKKKIPRRRVGVLSFPISRHRVKLIRQMTGGRKKNKNKGECWEENDP